MNNATRIRRAIWGGLLIGWGAGVLSEVMDDIRASKVAPEPIDIERDFVPAPRPTDDRATAPPSGFDLAERERERVAAIRRREQCDDTCTVDCGHCKGAGAL